MAGRQGGRVKVCLVRLREIISSEHLEVLSVWLFNDDQRLILSSSSWMEEELHAGTRRVVSSANLTNLFPGTMQVKSLELIVKSEGPMADPCTTLALMVQGAEMEERNLVQC